MSAHTTVQNNRTTGQHGSAMITAIILSTIIMFGLAGLLPMVMTDLKISEKNSMQEAAFALAESGVEEGIWAILEFDDVDADWITAGWNASSDGKFWYKEWTLSGITEDLKDDYTLDEERNGTYRVLVQKVEGSSVNIVSQGRVEGGVSVPNGYTVKRYIETKFTRPDLFDGKHLVARGGNTLSDNGTFDSYESKKGKWNATNNSNSNVSIGSVSTDLEAVAPGGAEIKGDIVTGGADDGSDPYGGADYTGETIYNYDMDFPVISAPDTTGWKTYL